MSTPQFDPDSPYAKLRWSDHNGYMRASLKGHPTADKSGKIRIHRAVLWDAIGAGPHPCHWCEYSGLRWDVPLGDPDFLIVDHVDGDKRNATLVNLVPSHKFCNDYRSVIEELGIPWSTWRDVPPVDRKPLQESYRGAPTAYALTLAAIPAPPPEPVEPPEPAWRQRLRAGGWIRWDDVVDVAELAKGNVRLRPPPAELLAAHPELRPIDFTRFGRS